MYEETLVKQTKSQKWIDWGLKVKLEILFKMSNILNNIFQNI